jgi:peptidoglycan/xylan/chitin deacetylase (PgdA/CDA1 family)
VRTHVCFHGIGTCVAEREPGEARYWMTEDLFLRVLDEVRGLPHVDLSFDDGNRSDLEVALPALCERDLTATFFPLAGRLDDPASLGAEDLRQLRAAGMTIGTHGWRHVPWRGLSVDDVQREFVDARIALQDACGALITSAALPLGRYDGATLRGLKDAGYRAVFTSDRFPARPSSWLQARYSVTSGDTLGSVRRILRGRPGPREARNLLASAIKRSR